MDKKSYIKNSKKIVVKIGTSILTDIVNGTPVITEKHIKPIIDSVIINSDKRKFSLVSSGAIGFGMSVLNLKRKPKTLSKKQAAAAIGQNKMMQMYDKLFAKHNKTVAQVLLTQPGIMNRRNYLNAINTLKALYKLNVIPIINENDTVAVDEIKFGDNDKLAAMVSNMINADLLILLTDIDGVLKNVNDKNSLIEEVENVDENLMKLCGQNSKSTTTGGMISKLKAVQIARDSGIPMIICNGYTPDIIDRIFKYDFKGTFFYPEQKVLAPRKRWIRYNLKSEGKIIIDIGAVNALRNKKSLLPSGITKISLSFSRGSRVSLYSEKNEKIAVGLTNYNSDELNKIKGLKTKQIKNVLGYKDYNCAVHIDNMVLV